MHDLITYKCGFSPFASGEFLILIFEALEALGEEYLLDDKTIKQISNPAVFNSFLLELMLKRVIKKENMLIEHDYVTNKSKNKNVELLIDNEILFECKWLKGDEASRLFYSFEGVRPISKGNGGELHILKIPSIDQLQKFEENVYDAVYFNLDVDNEKFKFIKSGSNFFKIIVDKWSNSSLINNIEKCRRKIGNSKLEVLLYFRSDLPFSDSDVPSSLLEKFKIPVILVIVCEGKLKSKRKIFQNNSQASEKLRNLAQLLVEYKFIE